jgi:hypothetical protein
MYGLGRLPSPPDERDWQVGQLLTMIKAGEAVPVQWNCPVLLHQGNTGHCVGFAGAGWKATKQASMREDPSIANAEGHRLYYEAKKIDGSGPEHLEDGTYLRALAKVLKAENVISAYAFGTFEEVNNWVQQYGPVILGTVWYTGMFTPDSKGIVHLTGKAEGGHAYLMRGDKQSPADNLCRNSWGEWGIGGDFYLTDADLYQLLDAGGEALMAVRKPVRVRGGIGAGIKYAIGKGRCKRGKS